jgi:Beta protein
MAAKSKKVKVTKKAARAQRALEPVAHVGLQFSHKHYVFIAKLKRGEIWALNYLSTTAKAATTPLLEICPPQPGRQLATYATETLETVRAEWGLPFFLDTRYLISSGGPSPASAQIVFGAARALNLEAVPVTSIAYSSAFQNEIRNVIAADGRGVMIRLLTADFNNPALLSQYLTALMQVLQVAQNQVDILIDLEYRPEQVAVQQLGSYSLVNLPSISDWRTVTLAAGCFPDSISNMNMGNWNPVPRSDWSGWLQTNAVRSATGLRQASFGDYGIRCGGPPRNIPNTPAPNIRYSDLQQVLVRRGSKSPGTMRAICTSLVGMPNFSGAQFSQGDLELAAKATNPGSANGSPENWIQWCTNHHLALTVSQIQNLP